MLNIHLKIEAKKLSNCNFVKFANQLETSVSNTLNTLYYSFDCDTFLLPYKVQKLSKKARRSTKLN